MELKQRLVKGGNLIKKKTDYSENQLIIGIDPGKSGGIAWIVKDDLGNAAEILAENCPAEIDDMSCLIKNITKDIKSICYLESVHAFPTDARSSAFKFGMNFGIWQGILSSFNVEVVLVTPRKRHRHFGELPKIKKERKNKMKQIATELSGLKATLKTADAILLTIYGYSMDIGGKWKIQK